MAESMSNLEYTLRNVNGINIMLRKKLIKAYVETSSREVVSKLVEDNTRLINADLLPRLRQLVENEDS
jgi:hypothetical protein